MDESKTIPTKEDDPLTNGFATHISTSSISFSSSPIQSCPSNTNISYSSFVGPALSGLDLSILSHVVRSIWS